MNKTVLISLPLAQPYQHKNMMVYFSDNFFHAPDVRIKNLYIATGMYGYIYL